MDFFPGMETFIEKLLDHLIENYAGVLAIGAYILAVMAIGTIVLALVIIHQSIEIPVKFVSKTYKKVKGEE